MKQKLIRNIINFCGPKLNKKIVVIESDDWGAIRMPSKDVYNYLVKKACINPDDPFTKYDTLESDDDLTRLFEVLTSIKDNQRNYPVLTANCVVANPDFKKIKDSHFTNYFYTLLPNTLEQTCGSEKCLEYWKEGKDKNIFFPQFHGREHLNPFYWLEMLQIREKSYLEAFSCQTYAIDRNVVAALAYRDNQEVIGVNKIVQEGYGLFEKLLGYPSKTFIAPNYTWGPSTENTLKMLGVNFLQGSKKQNVPPLKGTGKFSQNLHFNGQKNKLGQTYFVRNCLFEPTISPSVDYVDKCLSHIENAFKWKKPAIISSHRINFVGRLDLNKQSANLKKLGVLLKLIVKNWPDVEFVSTPELTKYYG